MRTLTRSIVALGLAAGTMAVAAPAASVSADPIDTCIMTAKDANGLSAELCGFIQAVQVAGSTTETVVFGCTAVVVGGAVLATGVGCGLLDSAGNYVKCACNRFLQGNASADVIDPSGGVTVPVQPYHLCTAWYYDQLVTGTLVSHACIDVTPV